MKLLKALTIGLVLPFAFVACDNKEEEKDTSNSGGAGEKADTHESVTEEYFKYMKEAMGAMASVDSKEAAEKFVADAKEVKPKLEELLETAKALPAPSDEQKSAIQATHKEIETKMMEKMMALSKERTANPPSAEVSAEIGEVMKTVMQGEFSDQMEAITEGFGEIYGFE